MTVRDPWAERYNRRTRALERQAAAVMEQANALDRIASALEVSALADTLGASPVNTGAGTSRVWTKKFASETLRRLSAAAERIVS